MRGPGRRTREAKAGVDGGAAVRGAMAWGNGVVWWCIAWRGVAWRGAARRGVVWRGVA